LGVALEVGGGAEVGAELAAGEVGEAIVFVFGEIGDLFALSFDVGFVSGEAVAVFLGGEDVFVPLGDDLEVLHGFGGV
jgi:hypothetical protein